MVTTVTEVLNTWNSMGVFSYVIPFLLIFAVVFAILKNTGILGDDNDSILAIISVAIGLLALQFDFVSEFYAVIFPRFGIGLSVFLIAIILLGFFFPNSNGVKSLSPYLGYAIAGGVIFWAFYSWGNWTTGLYSGWFETNIWAIVIGALIVGAIVAVVNSGKDKVKKVKP